MPNKHKMENQTPHQPPQKKKMAIRDMILIALAVLVMVRVDWANMNSFHYLILFMLVLCFMLRWSNMRKDAARQQKMEEARARAQAEQNAAAEDAPALLTDASASEQSEAAPAQTEENNTAQ